MSVFEDEEMRQHWNCNNLLVELERSKNISNVVW